MSFQRITVNSATPVASSELIHGTGNVQFG
jgi:hypothetical protein